MHRSNSVLCLHCTVDVVVVVAVNDNRWCEIDDGLMGFSYGFEQVVPNWQLSVIMNRMMRSVIFILFVYQSNIFVKIVERC